MPSKGGILHVEDNADNRHLIRRVLESEGYEVIGAANGTRALDFLDSMSVDLALLEFNMPDIDGYTLATRIRATPKFAGLPILAMTANVMHGDRERSLDAGCDGYILKPIDIDVLSMQLERYIRRNSRGQHRNTTHPHRPRLVTGCITAKAGRPHRCSPSTLTLDSANRPYFASRKWRLIP